jgi:hypothetical protein
MPQAARRLIRASLYTPFDSMIVCTRLHRFFVYLFIGIWGFRLKPNCASLLFAIESNRIESNFADVSDYGAAFPVRADQGQGARRRRAGRRSGHSTVVVFLTLCFYCFSCM